MATWVFVHGTWGRGESWPSAVRDALVARGHTVLPNFLWSGTLGGVWRYQHDAPDDVFDDGCLLPWGAEADHLIAHCYAHAGRIPVNVLAHSHGGQVAALAIMRGTFPFHDLVTLATPVRKDMAVFYEGIPRRLTGRWLHVHGDLWRDWTSRLGQLFDGDVRWSVTMPHATNLHVPGAGHAAWPLAEAWLKTNAMEATP